MFPTAARFDPLKMSDVPGPNSYNLNQESQLDAYKRGAFLEKTDRFNEKQSDVPGPGTYETDIKRPAIKSKFSTTQTDRYALLQRKVDELERVHTEDKKAHHSSIERLKLDLARYQKAHTDQSTISEKLKKQNDLLELRNAELQKSQANDQMELKSLKHKLRMAENATRVAEQSHAQLVSQVGDVRELKKELKERDRRISELEKERKKREGLEAKLRETQAKGEQDVQAVRDVVVSLKRDLASARDELQDASSRIARVERDASVAEADLQYQLDKHYTMMTRMAQAYAHLAASTVPEQMLNHAKQENATLHLQNARLVRKLANSEGQVVELANFARQMKEENVRLSVCLQSTEQEVSFYVDMLGDALQHQTDLQRDARNSREMAQAFAHLSEEMRPRSNLFDETISLSFELSLLHSHQLLFAYSVIQQELDIEATANARHSRELVDASTRQATLASEMDQVRQSWDSCQLLLRTAEELAEGLRSSSEKLKLQVKELESKLDGLSSQHQVSLKKEQDTAQRLTLMVQKGRMAEDGLRAEIETLTCELADAERYQEAYYTLSDEVGALVARKALAEEEAKRLSEFNAEIIGHQNPAQRILYVERIRNELAETKQKLIHSVRSHENAVVQNDDLQRELEMYKSVMVPMENKPRTHITRVKRQPLVNVNQSFGGENQQVNLICSSERNMLETIPADMTLDEIM
ncbi:hypothetical protein C8J56DRAFT_927788 [Mycena floridula]|nr:hypothetical protein C8J56DRAFT_927788 [Mycena floridula]